MKHVLTGLVALTSLALAPVALAADDAEKKQGMQPSKAMQVMMDDDMKDFFETAASANQFEIESSKVALQQATDPALKEYARKMIKDHTAASGDLQKLARTKNVTLSTALLRRHEAMLNDLKGEKAGEDFDDEYRDKMIASHKEAVSLFDEAARDSKDPEVKAFAAKLLPKLQAHGSLAQELPDADDADHEKHSRR